MAKLIKVGKVDHKVKSKKFIEKNCDWKILIIIKTTGIYTLNLYH